MQRYELSEGKSHKFWQIARSGKTLRFVYGRIGTDGQTLEKSFASPAAAEKEEAKLVAEKTKKGYRPFGAKVSKASKAPSNIAVPIGRVSSASNFVGMVAVDGALAAAYRYPFDEEEPDHLDFDETLDGPLPIGKGEGLFIDMGSSGYADIYRFGDTIVLADLTEGDDDVDAESEKLRAIAAHPTTRAKRIGAFEVPSGVLVLMGQHDDGPKLDLAKVKKSAVVKTKGGAAIAVAPGRYEIWREELYKKPVRGPWGTMTARVRVVKAGTKVVEKAPILDLAPAPKAHAPSRGNHRYVNPKSRWMHARTIAVGGDGMVFAGEDKGFSAAAWNADGSRAWQQVLDKRKMTFGAGVSVQLVGPDLLALPRRSKTLLALDPKTGKTRRTMRITEAEPEHFLVAGGHLFLHVGLEVRVKAYPGLKPVATLDHYTNSLELERSPDGRWFATSTSKSTLLYDAKKWKLAREIEGEVRAIAFTTDNKLLLGSDKSVVRLVDPKTGKKLASFDVAKERSRKPSIERIVCTAKHIAVSRVDGTTVLLDARTRKVVKLFEKHTTQSYFGPPVCFSPDETTLWVGACPKGPAGLSGYDVSAI